MHKKGKSLLIGVALALVACVAAITPAQAQQRQFGFGTATSTAAAATINQTSGVITTESLTTAALTDYTFTLTNSAIETTNAVVLASIQYGGAGTPIVQKITPAAGSCVIVIRNQHATVALNATMKIAFVVISR
jgi:hypothetical protein